jgi:hypothetical protein
MVVDHFLISLTPRCRTPEPGCFFAVINYMLRMNGRMKSGIFNITIGTVAVVGLIQTYLFPFSWNCGPSGRYWEKLRRQISRVTGALLDDRAGPRPVSSAEYAGTLPMGVDAAEELLWQSDFVRNPFSRLKNLDGRSEIGSWVYRESPLAERQFHLMLFRTESGSIAVYAHEEPSSVHPFVVATHFRGAEQDVAAGVSFAREVLPLDTVNACIEPTDEPWSEQADVDR